MWILWNKWGVGECVQWKEIREVYVGITAICINVYGYKTTCVKWFSLTMSRCKFIDI